MDPRRETRRLAMQLLYAIDLGRLGRAAPAPAPAPGRMSNSGDATARDDATAQADAASEIQPDPPPDPAPLGEPAPDHGVLLDAIDAEFDADPDVRRAAVDLAVLAWRARDKADAICAGLAPDWPPSRQPPVDRSILRLALCEIATGRTPMKVAINEAVELAKKYAGEDSPNFINGLLDKAAKQLPPPPEAPPPPEGEQASDDAAPSSPPPDPHQWLDEALKAKV